MCSSFTALFRPNLRRWSADLLRLPVGRMARTTKAQIEIYARGQDAGAPVNITYPGMVLGPPVGDQFGSRGCPVRIVGCMSSLSGAVVDRRSRDVAALRCWNPGVAATLWEVIGPGCPSRENSGRVATRCWLLVPDSAACVADRC